MWLALTPEEPRSAVAVARMRDEGWLAAWPTPDDASAGAWKVDPRIVDPRGSPATVALSLAPPDVALPFDDPAVVGAIRSALSSEPALVASTLMNDEGDYVGALIAPPHLVTPFATIFPSRTLRVGPGLLARPPWPAGPGTQRYASDLPWPYGRFPQRGRSET